MLKSNRAWRRFVGLPLIVIVASLSLIYSGSAWLQSPAQEGPYDDVSARDEHAANISHLKSLGVFAGTECGDGNFCPDESIDRKTMAVWLVRVLEGDNAPGLVDPSSYPFDFSSLEPETQTALAQFFNLTPEQVEDLKSRFSDVPYSYPEHNFIERLTELEISGGCSKEPSNFCPDNPIPRSHMAAFLVRAFDLEPAKNPAGFVDVSNDNSAYENITRLAATTIDTHCEPPTRFCFESANLEYCSRPTRFCPDDAVTRRQMASLLARAIDWQRGRAEATVTGSDDSIGLTVTYDEEEYEMTASWSAPPADNGLVSHYVLQSRTILEDFGPTFYQVIGSESNKTSYRRVNPSNSPRYDHLYAFRVITVYAGGQRLASSEVKVPTKVRRLRDLIWEKVVEPNQKQQPWLTDTWVHMNDSARFTLAFGGGKVSFSSEDPHPNGLKRVFIRNLHIGSGILENQTPYNTPILIEEMGHVYTLTNQVGKNSAPIGIGQLYLHLLTNNHLVEAKRPSRCSTGELYGDLAKMVFWGRYSDFDAHLGLKETLPSHEAVGMTEWSSCGFRLDSEIKAKVDKYVPEIAKSVFVDQEIPQWFYDTYQKPDKAIDLEKLWADITVDMSYRRTMAGIIHHLRNEFGGYCSEEEVRKFVDGEATGMTNPWKDGGCNDSVVIEGGRAPSPPNTNGHNQQTLDISELIRSGRYGSYSLSFLQKHNKPTNCWIAVNGYVFDVTPGSDGYEYTGPGQITDLCGQDVSEHFSSNALDLPSVDYLKGGLRS